MWQQAYFIFVTNNYAPFHISQRKNLVKFQKVSKYNDHDCSIKIISYEISQVVEPGKT